MVIKISFYFKRILQYSDRSPGRFPKGRSLKLLSRTSSCVLYVHSFFTQDHLFIVDAKTAIAALIYVYIYIYYIIHESLSNIRVEDKLIKNITEEF